MSVFTLSCFNGTLEKETRIFMVRCVRKIIVGSSPIHRTPVAPGEARDTFPPI